jgi:type VI secretion system secreted protein Hcp
MGSTVFLALEGVDGESADDRHRGEIELETWAFGVSSSGTAHRGGGGAGVAKAQVSDLSVTKSVDLATPALLEAVASGRRLLRATLTARRTADGQHDYLVIVMAPVLVSSCQLADDGDGAGPRETVHLSFGTVQLTYTSQGADGGAGPSSTFGWDVTKNARL